MNSWLNATEELKRSQLNSRMKRLVKNGKRMKIYPKYLFLSNKTKVNVLTDLISLP